MDREEEPRKRKERPSPGSESGEEASRQNPRQRNTDRPDGSGSSPQFNLRDIPHRPAQQPAQDEEMPDASSHVAEVSSSQGDGKQRLFLGDGGLSGSLAMTRKHPKTAPGMHATSFESEDHELFKEGSEGFKRKKELEEKGARVSHDIDATKLSKQLGEEKYASTHFNYPRSGKRTSEAPLIRDYAKSAHPVLEDDGQLHITLPSSKTYGKRQGKKEKATRNRLYGGTPIKDIEAEGFKFQEKRRDPQERYGEHGYSHEITGTETSRSGLHGHEYVFKKSNDPSSPNQKEYSDVETGSGTESTGSEEKRREEMEQ